jgi:hypothetical protein
MMRSAFGVDVEGLRRFKSLHPTLETCATASSNSGRTRKMRAQSSSKHGTRSKRERAKVW